MTKNTIKKPEKLSVEIRFFISSLALGVKEVARAIRSHWMVENYHWHLDVTFREDDDNTLEKQAAFNLNILKPLDVSRHRTSLKSKRKIVGWNPVKYFQKLLEI